MKNFRVLSLFDGCAMAHEAIRKSEVGRALRPISYFASEIDVYAVKVAEKRVPYYRNIGDVRLVSGYTYDGFESNTWTGGTGWSTCPLGDPDCQNGWDYETTLSSIVTNATAGTGGCYRGNYCAKYTGSYGFIERGFPETLLEGTKAFNITYAVKFSGFQTGETIEVYIFDGNWHR